MNLIVVAIILAVVAAAVDYFIGIVEPWRKLIYAGIVILFVVGLVLLVLPMLRI